MLYYALEFLLRLLIHIYICLFLEGVVEVWLTSEDTGAYGRDIGTNIVELMKKIVEVIPDGCMLRIGMTNPPYILEHLEVFLFFSFIL
jgi:tRNA A37 methylthiotransferase MiaB